MSVLRAPLTFQDGTVQITAATPGAAAVPTDIPNGSTFRVTAGTQVLYHVPITVEGTLQVDGYLVAV